MKNTPNLSSRAPVMNAIQTGLRNLLAMELEHLQLQPDPDSQEIQATIDALCCSRSDPDTYDAMFNLYLESLPAEGDEPPTPAALGRIYTQWDHEQQSRLNLLAQQLIESTAKAAEKRLRAAVEDCVATVLTTSSVYGRTVTEKLELMNPTAADTSHPVVIHGPDGLRAPIRHWYQILLLPLQALAERGAISKALCPVRLQGARHPVLELTPDDESGETDAMSKRARALPGGFTLWIHHSTPQICRITAETLRALGHQPDTYTVQYHPRDLGDDQPLPPADEDAREAAPVQTAD